MVISFYKQILWAAPSTQAWSHSPPECLSFNHIFTCVFLLFLNLTPPVTRIGCIWQFYREPILNRFTSFSGRFFFLWISRMPFSCILLKIMHLICSLCIKYTQLSLKINKLISCLPPKIVEKHSCFYFSVRFSFHTLSAWNDAIYH